jgi:AraC-like DNA-binding protein
MATSFGPNGELVKPLPNEHLDGDIALADLATECGLSPGRFMRAFKKSFGMPVRRYLLYRRIRAGVITLR